MSKDANYEETLNSCKTNTKQLNIMKPEIHTPETYASTKRVSQNGISPLIDYCYSNDMKSMERERNALLLAVKAACADFECVSWGHDGDCGSGKIMEKLEETIQAERQS